jgi:hypothetical protein
MPTDEGSARSWFAVAPPPPDNPTNRRTAIVMVRWALAVACAYLMIFSDTSSGVRGLGPVVIVAFLASNLVLGRLSNELVASARFAVGIAILDTLLIGASLFCAGQVSVELVVLFLGVLVLTIAGFRLGIIAAVTVALTVASLLMAGVMDSQSPLWRSSMLLRVPLLLSAAIVYAWLAEVGHKRDAAHTPTGMVEQLGRDLMLQLASIKRCQVALSEGTLSKAHSVLNEVAVQNQEMLTKVGAWPPPATDPHDAPATARNAA